MRLLLPSAVVGCLFLAAQFSAAQAQSPEDSVEADFPPAAFVRVMPKPTGNVVLLANASRFRQPLDLSGIVRQAFGCESKTEHDRIGYAQCVCKRLLPSDRHRVNAWLHLAPLVVALRKGGARRVDLAVEMSRWPGPLPAPLGAWRQDEFFGQLRYNYSYAPSASHSPIDALPPPLFIQLGYRPAPLNLLVPLVLALSAPALIAIGLRYRARRKPASPVLAWMSWIHLGSWLFWIVALTPSRAVTLLDRLPTHGLYPTLLAGMVLFAAPPLLATTIALAALKDGIAPREANGGVLRFLTRNLFTEIMIAALSGSLVVGTALTSRDWRAPFAGFATAVAVGAIALSMRARRSRAALTVLESGEFRDRVVQIADRAGVKLERLWVVRDGGPHEANAAALRQSRLVIVSSSLLKSLTKREVDAVVGHELGHLQGWQTVCVAKIPWAFAVVYFSFGAALNIVSGETPAHFSLEPWFPALALALVFLEALLRRSNEFGADFRSAQMTGDPQGMIAALARLTHLRQAPVGWGRIQGLLLTHPSPRRRVLMLAWRFRILEQWALTILSDPNALGGGPYGATERYTVRASTAQGEPVFSKTAMAVHGYRSGWIFRGALAVFPLGLSYAVTMLLPAAISSWRTGLFLLALPLALWLSFRTVGWFHNRFLQKMVCDIGPLLPQTSGGEFFGLWPGEEAEPVEGFFSWDLGKIVFSGDRLVYLGERARFALPRTSITAFEVVRAPLPWVRRYGVRVRWSGGSFVVRHAVKLGTRRQAAKLRQQWIAWWKGEQIEGGAEPAAVDWPMPGLPALPSPASPRSNLIPMVRGTLLLLTMGVALSLVMPDSALSTLAAGAPPVLFFIAVLPMLAPRRAKPQPAAKPATALH